MKKMEAYEEATKRGSGFLANVLLNQHSQPTRKLRGLVKLLNAGHTAEVAQFSLDHLLIDGHKASWVVLDEWARR